jgi:hypothetical protein
MKGAGKPDDGEAAQGDGSDASEATRGRQRLGWQLPPRKTCAVNARAS